MQWNGIIIFGVTYALISARRLSWIGLDRPAGALLGAVCCVIARVLKPEEALAAVNGSTILLLLGVMGMGAFLAKDGFFSDLERPLLAFARTRTRLLGCIVWGSGLLSALITNDAVCVLGAPLVVRLIQAYRLPPLPYLLAIATAANTGSVATLVGNPQNMLCAILGGLSYRDYLLVALPLALVCLAINHALLLWCFRRCLQSKDRFIVPQQGQPLLNRRTGKTLGVIAATAVAYTLGADLAWAAVAGFTSLMLLHRQDPRQVWCRIDGSLLVFFAGLFIVVEAFLQSGAPAWFFARWPLVQGSGKAQHLGDWFRLSGIFLLGSNIVSNVPFILVIREQMAALVPAQLGWELLAMASTFAGNLTLLGSVANIIVAESARDIGGIGFGEYLRVGVPLALLTTLLGVLWLVFVFTS
jgi:Na+/H+ antiporter NhaD/arsenite permease-like protein